MELTYTAWVSVTYRDMSDPQTAASLTSLVSAWMVTSPQLWRWHFLLAELPLCILWYSLRPGDH